MKKIIIIGTRQRNFVEDYRAIKQKFFDIYKRGDAIVSGGCSQGGDRFAEILASKIGCTEENGLLVIHLPEDVPHGSPRWAYAKANFERNTIVAQEADEDSHVIACILSPTDPLESVIKRKRGGTEDTIKKIVKMGRCKNIHFV